MGVNIRRLKYLNDVFVPVTAEEAVAVKATASNMGALGYTETTYTTLAKVLERINTAIANNALTGSNNASNISTNATAIANLQTALGTSGSDTNSIANLIAQINEALNQKLGTLTAGSGIEITDSGEIKVTYRYSLYSILDSLPEKTEDALNKIYIIPNNSGTTNNVYIEYILVKKADGTYEWEKLGEHKADVDLSNYVTKDDVTSELSNYVKTNTLNTTLASYYTKTEVDTQLGNYQKTSTLNATVRNYLSTELALIDTNTANIAANTTAISNLNSDKVGVESLAISTVSYTCEMLNTSN